MSARCQSFQVTTASSASISRPVHAERVDFKRRQVVAEGEREVADAGDHGREGVEVGGRATAHPVEHGPAAQPAEQLPGPLLADRQRGEHRVLQYLDEDAAERDREHRAPERVRDHADEQFGPAAAHRADQHAVDDRRRRRPPRRR